MRRHFLEKRAGRERQRSEAARREPKESATKGQAQQGAKERPFVKSKGLFYLSTRGQAQQGALIARQFRKDVIDVSRRIRSLVNFLFFCRVFKLNVVAGQRRYGRDFSDRNILHPFLGAIRLS